MKIHKAESTEILLEQFQRGPWGCTYTLNIVTANPIEMFKWLKTQKAFCQRAGKASSSIRACRRIPTPFVAS